MNHHGRHVQERQLDERHMHAALIDVDCSGVHALLIVQLRIVHRVRRRDQHAASAAGRFQYAHETMRARLVDQILTVAHHHVAHEARHLIRREKLAGASVAHVQHHERAPEHVAKICCLNTDLVGHDQVRERLDEMVEFSALVLSDHLQVALFARLALRQICTGQCDRADFHPIAPDTVDAARTRDLPNETDDFLLMGVRAVQESALLCI
ncbi:hypothetical protein D3C71_1306010 [compost metagenome]